MGYTTIAIAAFVSGTVCFVWGALFAAKRYERMLRATEDQMDYWHDRAMAAEKDPWLAARSTCRWN